MNRPDLSIVPPVDYDTRPDLYESLRRDAARHYRREARRALRSDIGDALFYAAVGAFAALMCVAALVYVGAGM